MRFTIFISIAIAALAISCGAGVKQQDVGADSGVTTTPNSNMIQLTREQYNTAGIETGTADEQDFYSIVRASGTLEAPPHNVVSISAPMAGFVKRLSLLPGTRVKAGEIIAVLEDQQYIQLQQDYLTIKSKLEYLKVDYERQKALNETKAASDKVYQQARAEYENHKILLKSYGEKLRLIGIDPGQLTEQNISRNISIRSPINGYVTEVHANMGKHLSPADIICEIVDPKNLHLDLKVFENNAAQLQRGMKVVYYGNSDSSKKHHARIELIRPSIDNERTTEVHCELQTSDPGYLPGMFMNAEIHVNSARANVLPEDAIVRWNQGSYVFVEAKPLQFEMVPVTVGNINNGFTEIQSDLRGKKIVTKNAYTLLMELKNSGDEAE